MGDFSTDLDKIIEKAGKNADAVIKKVVLAVGTELVEVSPVGDPTWWESEAPEGYVGGRFRSNWSHSVGQYDSDIEHDITSKRAAISRIKDDIPSKASGLVHYITNNLSYAIALEEGHSDQSPFGMVELTRWKLQNFIDDAVKEVD